MSLATATVTTRSPRRARKTIGEQVKRSSAAEVIDHAAAAAQRRVQVGDPLLDLMERTRLGYLSAEAAEDEAASDAIYDPLFEEQKNAPAATSMAGVLAALRYGVSDIQKLDSTTAGILRGALVGLERIVGSQKPDDALPTIAKHDPLLDIVNTYFDGVKAFNASVQARQDLSDAEQQALYQQLAAPSLRRVTEPLPAPTTPAGAIAGLDLLKYELEEHAVGPQTWTLIEAVRRYFGDQKPSAAPMGADPIFPLIEKHREACARVTSTSSEDPAFVALVDEETAAAEALTDATPSTLAGCVAVAAYFSDHPNRPGNPSLGDDAFDCLARGVMGLGTSAVLKPAASACEVGALGRRHARLLKAWEDADAAKGDERSARLALDPLYDQREIVRSEAAYRPASSLLGALFQASLVSEYVDRLCDIASLSPKKAKDAEQEARKAASCLYSIAGVLEAHAGVDRTEVGGEYSLPPYLDPHAIVDRCLGETVGDHG